MNLSFRKISILVIVVVAVMMIIGFDPVGVNIAQAKRITISGKITQIDWGMWTPSGRRKAVLHVKTAKGNLYQIHVGMRTEYIPHQSPEVGNRVSCSVEKVSGVWVGYTVRYR